MIGLCIPEALLVHKISKLRMGALKFINNKTFRPASNCFSSRIRYSKFSFSSFPSQTSYFKI